MRRVFRILSSKLDRKLNHPRRARTTLRSKVNIYGTIIRRVYGEYTIPVFLVISAHAQTLGTRPLFSLPLRGLGTRLVQTVHTGLEDT